MIKYRRITKKDKDKVEKLIGYVISNLENKDFFINFEKEEVLNLYNEYFVVLYGAFDCEKLVGMAGMYISGEHLEELKMISNLKEKNIVELRSISCFTRI